MKTKSRRVLSLFLALLMMLSVMPIGTISASAEKSGDFEYSVISEKDKTCEITGYTGSASELTIPSQLDGYTVTSIGYMAFDGYSSLTSITIPNSVTSIDTFSFRACTSLTNIEIPDSVTYIGSEVFAYCTSLKSATIGNGLTNISRAIFKDCSSLTNLKIGSGVTSINFDDLNRYFAMENIYVNAENKNYSDVDGVLCNKNATELIYCPKGRRGDYTISSNVTSIGDYAFQNCTLLTSIKIGNSVTSIGYRAFDYCVSLTSVTIPNSVTSIGYYAFDDCKSLTSVTIPNSVTSIGYHAFGYENHPYYFSKIPYFIIYGASGSEAERYAKENEFKFIDVSTDTGKSYTLVKNSINLSLFNKAEFLKGRINFINEHSSSANHRLKSVQLKSANKQQIFDETVALTSEHTGKSITFSKEGYLNYTVPDVVIDSWLQDGSLEIKNIYMANDKKDGKPYISGAYAKENRKSVAYTDLQSETLIAQSDTAYNIILTAETNGESVKEYVLSQDNAHKLSSQSGIFLNTVIANTFVADKKVYAYVKTESGKTSEPVELNLSVTDLKIKNNTFSLIGNDAQKITYSKDAALVGGAELSLDGFTFPLGIEVEGNRFKISFGIDIASLKKEIGMLNGKWEYFKTNVKTIVESTDDAYKKQKKFNDFYKMLKSEDSYEHIGENFDLSFLGYAEGYIVNGNFIFTDTCGELAGKFTFQYTQQGIIWAVPVYAYVKAGAEVSAKAQFIRLLPDSDVPFDFGININLEPELKFGGGIGVKGAVSGGLYGSFSMPLLIKCLEGYSNIKIKGQVGIEGEFFCFNGKKELLNGSVTLYDGFYRIAKGLKSQNTVSANTFQSTINENETKTVTTVMSRNYAENTTEWFGASKPRRVFALRSAPTEGLTVKTLQKSVFKNSQTQLIALDDGKMMMAWIEDDSARDTYNRMRLVYSIYENGLWSTPKAVYDDGTNDAYPSLATDGKTVYIVWQNVKCNLTSVNEDTINTILKNSEISIAKYNADNEAFEDVKILTDNSFYDYSPVLAVENGQAVLYWVENSSNDLTASGNNAIYRYSTDECTTSVVKSNLNYISDMACVFADGNDEVSFSMDVDGDLATVNDVRAHTLSDGILTRQLDSNQKQTADFAVTYGKLDGQNTLFFADNTNIYYKQDNEVKKVFSSRHTISGDLQVVENGNTTNLLWTESADIGTELWQSSYNNGIWSEPIQISDCDALLHNVSVVYQNGVIHGVLNRTVRTLKNGEYVNAETDLCYITLSDYTDLDISFGIIDETAFIPGTTAEIPICIKNNGTKDINEVDITITDAFGTEKTVHREIMLSSGEEIIVNADYIVPTDYQRTTLTVTANVLNETESNVSNNTDSSEIGYANISVSEISINDIGEYFTLSAVLKNRNPIDAKNVSVEVYSDSEDGKLCELIHIGDLIAGEMYTVQYIVKKSAVNYDENNIGKICFKAITDNEEITTLDNISYAVLENKSTDFDTPLGDIDGNGEINSNDYAMVRSYVMCQSTLTEEQRIAADYNRDGVVDAFDAIAIDFYIHTK